MTILRIPTLALVDGLALLVFIVAGVEIHGTLRLRPVLRDAAFVLSAWYVAAGLLGLYRASSPWRVVLVWAVALPAGLLLRQWAVGRLATRATLAFLAAALPITLGCLLTGRLGAALARRRSR
ncbi:MAG TPA: DUF3054 family protein [bacterium]|nr:DUF3054 family protein [bacterium]